MSGPLKQVRTKLFILAALILLSTYFAAPQRNVSACFECVQLTGGLCIGCDPNVSSGARTCVANQSSCTCSMSGSCGHVGFEE